MKFLKNINSNLEGLTFSFENQLSLNKMFEIQLAQITTTIPAPDFEKIPRQPKISFENVNVVITRDGKSSRDLPYPNHAGEAKKHRGTTPNLRLWASLGRGPPQGNVYLALSPLFVTLHKKRERREK